MATMSSAIPLTGVPFPRSEYERRQHNVLAAVASARLDALVVTAHAISGILADTIAVVGALCLADILRLSLCASWPRRSLTPWLPQLSRVSPRQQSMLLAVRCLSDLGERESFANEPDTRLALIGLNAVPELGAGRERYPAIRHDLAHAKYIVQ